MKINSFYKNYINFKSREYHDDGILGYDDSISQKRRSDIRNWQETYYTPYRSIYKKECNLSEYDFKQLIKSLTQITTFVDAQKLKDIQAYNVTSVGNKSNCYRGSTLKNKPESLKIVKEAGIKRIIDLVGYDSYKEAAEKAGLEYSCPKFGLFYDNVWLEDAFYINHNQDKNFQKRIKASVKRFVKLIETLQKEYYYIGCEYGTYKTDDYILLNYVFNPKAEANHIPYRDLNQVEKMLNLYHNLSQEDKARMGWTKEFDENVLKKLKQAEKRIINTAFF